MISRYASRKFAAFLSTSRCSACYCRSFLLLRTASQLQTRLTLAAYPFSRVSTYDRDPRFLSRRFVEKAGSIERIGRRSDREESGLMPLEIQRG